MVRSAQSKIGKTSIKNQMKGDIGMANYENKWNKRLHTLYNCVRQEMDLISTSWHPE